jgi:hypothetical protein
MSKARRNVTRRASRRDGVRYPSLQRRTANVKLDASNSEELLGEEPALVPKRRSRKTTGLHARSAQAKGNIRLAVSRRKNGRRENVRPRKANVPRAANAATCGTVVSSLEWVKINAVAVDCLSVSKSVPAVASDWNDSNYEDPVYRSLNSFTRKLNSRFVDQMECTIAIARPEIDFFLSCLTASVAGDTWVWPVMDDFLLMSHESVRERLCSTLVLAQLADSDAKRRLRSGLLELGIGWRSCLPIRFLLRSLAE